MSKEAQLRISLQIRAGTLDYRSNPTAFQSDVLDLTGAGPSPGKVIVTQSGVDISFTPLTNPSLCRIMNLDSTHTPVVGGVYFVEFGIHDLLTNVFYPLGELLPGETYVLRLSRHLNQELGTGTGTGAIGGATRLRLKAHGAPTNCLVEAFNQ